MRRARLDLRVLTAACVATLLAGGREARAGGVVDLDVGPRADVRSALEPAGELAVESESFRFEASAGTPLSISVAAPRRSRIDLDVALYDPAGVLQQVSPANVTDLPGRWTLRDVVLPRAGRWEVRITADQTGQYRMRLQAGGTGRPLRLDLRPGRAHSPGGDGTIVGTVIGAAGGVLTPLPRPGADALAGTLLTVPPGAFWADTRVVMTSALCPPLDDPVRHRAIGPAFRLLPDDLRFERPARVLVHVGALGLPRDADPAAARVLYVDPRGRRSVIVPSEVHLDGGSLAFETSRGGTFLPFLPRGKPSLADVGFVEMRLSAGLMTDEGGEGSVTRVVTSCSRSRYLSQGPLARHPHETEILCGADATAGGTIEVRTSHEPTFATSWSLSDDGRSVEVVRQDGSLEVWDAADDASVLVQRSRGGDDAPVVEFGAAVRVDAQRRILPAEVAGTWSVGVSGVGADGVGASLRPVLGAGTLVLRADRTWTWIVTLQPATRRGAERVDRDGGTFAPAAPEDGVESAQSIVLVSEASGAPRRVRLVFTSSLSGFAGIAEGGASGGDAEALFVAGTARTGRIDRRLAEGDFAGSSFGTGSVPVRFVAEEWTLRLPGDRSWTAETVRRKEIGLDASGVRAAVLETPAAQGARHGVNVSPRGTVAAALGARETAAGGFAADGAFGFLVLPGTPSARGGLLVFVRSQ